MSIFLTPVKHGRTGNNLFQLADAFHLAKLNPNIYLSDFEINELGFTLDNLVRDAGNAMLKITAHSPAEAEQLILANLNRGADLVLFLDYLNISPDLAFAEQRFLRSLFERMMVPKTDIPRTIIHIRAGDVWKSYRSIGRPIHPDYFPLPLSFYKKMKESLVGPVEIVSEEGGPDWYLRSVCKITAPVKLHVARDLAEDFQDFLNSNHLILSVSTLSWIASLIGNAEVIHYPKLGLFDPERRGDLLFRPPKPAYVYEFESHVWNGGSRLDKEWLIDSTVRVIDP